MDPRRYLDHLEGLLRAHPPQPRVRDGAVDLGYAAPLVSRLLGDGADTLEVPAPANVVDSFGHRRPAYGGLLLHTWARAVARGWNPAGNPPALAAPARRDAARRLQSASQERPLAASLQTPLPRWYDRLAQSFTGDLPPAPLPAAAGHVLTGQAWNALALFSGGAALGQPSWAARGEHFFQRLLECVEARTFMRVQSTDNLEPWWYHELVLLHAATSYALQRKDCGWLEFIGRCARFHYAETQPDHASTQPWGISAFLLSPDTAFLADQMIHSAITQGEGRPESVAAALFADTLDAHRPLQ